MTDGCLNALSSLTNLGQLFNGASFPNVGTSEDPKCVLATVTLFTVTSAAVDISQMFSLTYYEYTAANELKVGSINLFANMPNVENITYIFWYLRSMSGNTLRLTFDAYMFANCKKITTTYGMFSSSTTSGIYHPTTYTQLTNDDRELWERGTNGDTEYALITNHAYTYSGCYMVASTTQDDIPEGWK